MKLDVDGCVLTRLDAHEYELTTWASRARCLSRAPRKCGYNELREVRKTDGVSL